MKHRPNRTHQPITESVAAAFYARVQRTESCWTWTGKTDKSGYGVFYKDGGDFRAHRVAYAIGNGVGPGTMFVCHRCDNPRCVRPDHLFLGSNRENTADRHAKGRSAKGSSSGAAKLTESDVAAIRAALRGGAKQVDMAIRFGITQANVSEIARGKTWRHVT